MSSTKRYYEQTVNFRWLTTPKGTIWVSTEIDNYIQPENVELITTPLGVDLDLLDDEDAEKFRLIENLHII